ncbi:MAG: SulP family inorganic anion transporter [Pseudomonadales bacterium]|jgi:MFS superfamily sulfate permease-like transporter|nr:SulP family inorganic anion transporter [Pseudomonadales bacterium]
MAPRSATPFNFFSRELAAGLTLAAIAIPEQMATARLGGFSPQIGLIAFVAATAGFLLLGNNRLLSAGADSTITPIFAGALGALGLTATQLSEAAAVLALLVGTLVAMAGVLHLGRIADLLSKPVLTGFLAGIAVHIMLSQAPAALGIAAPSGKVANRLALLWAALPTANLLVMLIAFGTFAVTFFIEKFSPKLPGALLALVIATMLCAAFDLEQHGVATLGALPTGLPSPRLPLTSLATLQALIGLSFTLALVVMVQTGATTRAFSHGESDVNRDFIGMGAAGFLSGIFGAFAVNASPPRTAVAQEAGGRTRWTSVVAALVTLALLCFGSTLVAHTPTAALAGILLAIATRLVHVALLRDLLRRAPEELVLALLTVALIVFLPIETGVTAAIFLSLGHGLFSIARTRLVLFEHVAGTTIWWPVAAARLTEARQVPGVLVVGFQAPLTFLNAEDFRRQLRQWITAEWIAAELNAPRLLVLEASGIIEVDFTAAQILKALAGYLQSQGVTFAVARLEALRAQRDFERFGVSEAIGTAYFFRSVAEAVAALGPEGDAAALGTPQQHHKQHNKQHN